MKKLPTPAPASPSAFSHVAGRYIFALLAVLPALLFPLIAIQPAYADWGPDVQLSSNPIHAASAGVAVSGNYIHTSWQDFKSGSLDIYYRRSADGGAAWGPIVQLTSDPADSYGPRIAASGSYVYIVWYDVRDGTDEIYFKRSSDNGATWGPDTRLSDLPARSLNVSIAVSGSNVHIVWQDQRNGNRETYYKRSTDNGASWGPDILLSTAMPGFSQEPEVAASGDNVYVAWEYVTIGGNYDLYFRSSTDNGANWGAIQQLTTDPNTAWYVSLAVSGNIIHVSWTDDRGGNRDIYYKRSADGGATWGPDTPLTSDPSDQHQVNITSSGSNAFVAWADERAGANELVYYRQSTDGGLTWGPETCLSDTGIDCEAPVAFLDGNTVHVVWCDSRTGTNEAYYKRSPAASAPAITSFTPRSGGEGARVVITGTNFTDATAVNFGNTNAARFTVVSATRIVAYVGTRGTGKIRVTNMFGTGISNATFTFSAPEEQIGTTPKGSWLPGTTSAGTPTQPVQQAPVSMPSISVKKASLSAVRVAPGTPVTITAEVVNTGNAGGSSSIQVYVNGEVDKAQGVTINSGGSTPVTFTIARSEPGAYNVYVGGADAGSFTVEPFSPDTILIISGALVFFALILGVVYTARRITAR